MPVRKGAVVLNKFIGVFLLFLSFAVAVWFLMVGFGISLNIIREFPVERYDIIRLVTKLIVLFLYGLVSVKLFYAGKKKLFCK